MHRLPFLTVVLALALASLAGCAGMGEGFAEGNVDLPVCGFRGNYRLDFGFFSTQRVGSRLIISMQAPGASHEYQDGFTVVVDDTAELARRISASSETDANGARVLTVDLGPEGDPRFLVHAQFWPTRTCGRVKETRLAMITDLRSESGRMTFRSVDQGPDDPERLTEVTAFDWRLHDPRPVGEPAPPGVDPRAHMGDGTFSGRFKVRWSRGAPAQLFP